MIECLDICSLKIWGKKKSSLEKATNPPRTDGNNIAVAKVKWFHILRI